MNRLVTPFLATALLCVALCGCTARPVGYSDFDVGTDFSTFRSFTWISDSPLAVATPNPVNPALEGIVMEEVRRNLTSRGFRYTADIEQADFVVGLAVGGNPTMRTTHFTDNYRQVRIIGSSRDAQQVTQESNQGGLVIDFYDRASGNKKWMGWTLREITMSDQANLEPTVRELVTIILEHFPPDV